MWLYYQLAHHCEVSIIPRRQPSSKGQLCSPVLYGDDIIRMDTTAAKLMSLWYNILYFPEKALLIKLYCINIQVVNGILVHESLPRTAPQNVLMETPHRGLGTRLEQQNEPYLVTNKRVRYSIHSEHNSFVLRNV